MPLSTKVFGAAGSWTIPALSSSASRRNAVHRQRLQAAIENMESTSTCTSGWSNGIRSYDVFVSLYSGEGSPTRS